MIKLKKAIERTLQTGTSRQQGTGRRLEAKSSEQSDGAFASETPPAASLQPVDASGAVPEDDLHHPSIRVEDPATGEDVEEFSALELRDRVVIMLLFDQIITEDDVAQVWNLWKQEYRGDLKTALWRLLTLIPRLDRELILEETARVYGIEGIELNRRAVVPIVKNLATHMPKEVWERMVALRLIPIGEEEQRSGGRQQLVFASHDPTHPEVDALLQEIGIGVYTLRYVPEHEIIDVLAEVFPGKFRRLKKVLDEERRPFEVREKTLLVPVVLPTEETPEEPTALEEIAKPNTSSIISFFEELLVEAVRSNSSGMCLVPNKHGKTEVYVLADQELNKWRMIDHIEPEYLFSTIKSAIIRDELSVGNTIRNQILDRWIDGKSYRFHIFAAPAGKMMDREAILFRVV